jgi:hypothetical protein
MAFAQLGAAIQASHDRGRRLRFDRTSTDVEHGCDVCLGLTCSVLVVTFQQASVVAVSAVQNFAFEHNNWLVLTVLQLSSPRSFVPSSVIIGKMLASEWNRACPSPLLRSSNGGNRALFGLCQRNTGKLSFHALATQRTISELCDAQFLSLRLRPTPITRTAAEPEHSPIAAS